ncbi:MAG: ABC transporter permease subunit [Dehalococcoidia bacterium]
MIAPRHRRTTAAGPRWALLAALLLLPLAAWPTAALVWHAAVPPAAAAAAPVVEALRDASTWQHVAFTSSQALASMVGALAIGLPVAYVVARVGMPGRAVLRALAVVPLVLPGIAVALAFREVLGPAGWLNEALRAVGARPVAAIGTPGAIVLAHICYGTAIVVALVAPRWARLDTRQVEAARLLGAGTVSVFRHVTLPALTRPLLAAAVLAFGFAFTSFGVVLILGAPRTDTLEVAAYRLAISAPGLAAAAALTLLQLAATLVLVLLLRSMTRVGAATVDAPAGGGASSLPPTPPASTAGRAWHTLLALLACAAVAGLVVVPLLALAVGAIEGAPAGWHYRALLDQGDGTPVAYGAAALWSLAIAAGAAALATVAGAAAAFAVARSRGRRARILDLALWLPLALPPVTLAVGLTLSLASEAGGLADSPWPLLFAHALIGYPFVLWVLLPRVRVMEQDVADAATLLGASPWRVWRHVELPMAGRALLVGATLAFVVSLGELAAALLLARPAFTTLPVAAYEALAADDAGTALALAGLLAAVVVVAFMLVERLRDREAREC